MSDNLIFFILVKERLDISNVQRILSLPYIEFVTLLVELNLMQVNELEY